MADVEHMPSRWDDCGRFGDDPFRQEWSAKHPVRQLIARKAMSGDTVLECGCASCIDLDYFKDTHVRYTGIDITLSFIEGAKRHNPDVDVRYGNILDIPFGDLSFDTVYASNVFEHLNADEWVLAIDEMWRVARKQMLIAFYVVPDCDPVKIDKDGWGFNVIKYNIGELLERLCGFAECDTIEILRNIGNDNRMLITAGKPTGRGGDEKHGC